MRQSLIYKTLIFIFMILIVSFIIFICIDYSKYDSVASSASFSTYVLARLLEFVLPGFVLFIVALLLRRKR